MMDSKCEGCYYWQYIDSAFSDVKCCHFLLLRGHRKTVDKDGNCLSCKPKGE
jgi:hypothetical protein